LRTPLRPDKLNLMCRMTFAACAAFLALAPASAQQVPGRELYDFPLASMAEAPALATAAGGGFWNPATIALSPTDRFRAALSAFNAPIEQGVSAQVGTVAYRVRSGLTAGLSVATASVGDILRTDTDPQTIGSEIPYRSTILSAMLAAQRGAFTAGLALRRRSATYETANGSAQSVDVGILADRPLGLPFKAGLASFLLSPSRSVERASAVGAVEGYIPWHVEHDLRAGFSYQLDEGGGDERFGYVSGRANVVELRAGLARQIAFNDSNTRLRLGVGVHYAHYLVGVSREDGTAGLGASYQFFLSTVVPRTVKP
jgi:hypothetical protein